MTNKGKDWIIRDANKDKSDLVAPSGHWQLESDRDTRLPSWEHSERTHMTYLNNVCWVARTGPEGVLA